MPGGRDWCHSCSSVDMWTPRKAKHMRRHSDLLAPDCRRLFRLRCSPPDFRACAPMRSSGRTHPSRTVHPGDSTRRLAQNFTK
jgi:hypothetical protein